MEHTKFKRKELSHVKQQLVMRQGGICPICKGSLLGLKPENIVVDHDHSTGIVRAALHRGCNRVEGAVYKMIVAWGKAIGPLQVMKVAENLVNFWRLHSTPQTEWIYYDHKTPAEQLVLAAKRRKRAYASKRKSSP